MLPSCRPYLRLACLVALVGPAMGLVVAPPGRPVALESAVRALPAAGLARVRMQVDAPVKPKVPDNVPQLAPTKPSSDKDNEKAKKFKVLLFNDNVNRCAPPPRPARARLWASHASPPPLAAAAVAAHQPCRPSHVRRREYVARVLVGSIPDLTQADAYIVMQKAHKQGMAVVGVWVFEMAEAYCDKLKTGGLIASVSEEDD